MIERERVEQHATAALQMAEALRRHGDATAEQLAADIDLLSSVAHQMQIAIQSCLDAGAHALVAGGLNQFEAYRDIPARLASHGVVPANLGATMADLAGFRNVLVHHYLLVRVDLVHAKLAVVPDAVEQFMRVLLAWIDRDQGSCP